MSRTPALLGAASALLVLGAVACSLGISTSDYLGGSPPPPGGDGGGTDTTTTSDGQAPPPPAGHVALFGGVRDVVGPGDSNQFLTDVVVAPIDATGNLGPWSEAAPMPFGGGFAPSLLGGTLYSYGQVNSAGCCPLSLEWVPFDGGLAGPWRGASQSPAVPPPLLSNPGYRLSQHFVWGFGGEATVLDDAGVGVFTTYTTISNGTFDPSTQTIGAWQTWSNSLSYTRSRLTLFTHAGYIYAIGGVGNNAYPNPNFEYGTIDATGDNVGAFMPLPDVTDPVLKQPVALYQPTIVTTDTMLYVIGGSTDGGGSTPTNTVMTARFHPDGTIDPWALGPKLPSTLRGAAGFARNGILYLLGGAVTNTSRTDQVLIAHIATDGSLDGWTVQAGAKLPVGRSDSGLLLY